MPRRVKNRRGPAPLRVLLPRSSQPSGAPAAAITAAAASQVAAPQIQVTPDLGISQPACPEQAASHPAFGAQAPLSQQPLGGQAFSQQALQLTAAAPGMHYIPNIDAAAPGTQPIPDYGTGMQYQAHESLMSGPGLAPETSASPTASTIAARCDCGVASNPMTIASVEHERWMMKELHDGIVQQRADAAEIASLREQLARKEEELARKEEELAASQQALAVSRGETAALWAEIFVGGPDLGPAHGFEDFSGRNPDAFGPPETGG